MEPNSIVNTTTLEEVRFLNRDQTQFMPFLRREVDAYFQESQQSIHGNWKLGVKAFILLSLLLVPFSFILITSVSFSTLLLLSVVMGVGMAGVGMCLTHDSIHESLSGHGWINRLTGCSIYLIGGNVFNWRVHHNVLHHTFTKIYGYDEDLRISILRFSNQAPLLKIHRFQQVYALMLYSFTSLFELFADFGQLHRFNKSGITAMMGAKPGREMLIAISAKLMCLSLFIGLPLATTDFSWLEILLGFLIMHLTAGLIFGTIFQLAHVMEGTHEPELNDEGHIDNEWAIHQLYSTSNFANDNPLLSWFIGGLNFQVEHHLFPKICHIHHRDIAPIVESAAKEFGLPYHKKTSFREALSAHLRELKTLGKQPAYND